MTDLLKSLNKNQYYAVTSYLSVIKVLAGAGSGKTRVLTTRIAYLINHNYILPENILAITFTNKASIEMKERLCKLNLDTKKIWVMTFHVLCSKILRKWIFKLGYNNDFTIIDQTDQKHILKDIYKSINYSSEILPYSKCIDFISRYKIANTSNVIAQPIEDKYLNTIYTLYEQYLKKYNLLDFDDLLIKVLDLFRQEKEILNFYQKKFVHILVDEFQDTNSTQFEIIKKLFNKKNFLYVVGDPDQSIYKFRGSINNIFDGIEKLNDKITTIVLDENYRSNSSILYHSNKLISCNKNRIDKRLYTKNKTAIKPIVLCDEDNNSATMSLVNTIKEQVNTYKISYSDIAILYRSNYLSRGIEKTLNSSNIPYRLVGSISFWNRKEVKDLLCYISITLNPHNNFHLERIVNTPKRGIGIKTLDKVRSIASKKDISIIEAMKEIPNKNVKNLVKFINSIHKKILNNLYTTVEHYFEDIYINSLYKDFLVDNNEYERLENVQELKTHLIEFASEKKDNSIHNILNLYLDEVSLYTGFKESKKDCVNLMTVHSAKGLEFDTVIIYGANQGIFPSNRSLEQGDLEEERRLMYVAMTRAKKYLYFIYYKFDFFNKKNSPSVFLYDSELLIESSNYKNKYHSQNINIITPNTKTKFIIGDRVEHRVFGIGYVINVLDNEYIEVFFLNYNKKTILNEYLKKIDGL